MNNEHHVIISHRAMATTITNWLRQHHMSASSHSCAGARASFFTLYCHSKMTTHNKHHVQAHELSISHRAQAHELLIMAATTTYVDEEILRESARGIYIASRDGDDNNTGNDDDKCQRQGLGRKRPAFSYRVAQRQQRQQQL